MKNGWTRRSLSDITTKIGSGATPKGGRASYKQSGISLIRSLNVHDGEFRMKNLAFIDNTQAKQLDNVVVEAEDVLLNITGASIARCCVVPEEVLPARVNQHVTILRPDATQLLPRFLQYLLVSRDYKHQLLTAGGAGATRQALTKGLLESFGVKFPKTPEQRQIVGILDEAFDGIATAQANAEKNLQNARALFERHLNAVFTQRGDGWVEKNLGEVAEFKNGLNYTKNSDGQTLPVVGVGDFQSNYVVPIENLQSATIDGILNDNYAIRRNDILTVRSNGSKELVGRCMLVPDVSEVTSYSGFIIRIRVDTAEIAPRILLHFMKSSGTRDRLTRAGGGANISNINQRKLSSLPVSIPPFKKQEKIANRLDELSNETQRLETIYQRKLDALDELKKSLLHQAFSGELTTDSKATEHVLANGGK